MEQEKHPNTETMMGLLSGESFPTGDWSDFLDPDIRDFFDQLFLENGMQRSTVIRDANISRTYGYQLMDGTRIGKRDYYLSIAFAMKLDVRMTQRMLSVTNCSRLYPLIKRDAAIIFALNHGYDNIRLYEFLLELGLAPLDTGVA
ncbi:MAG: XRE family transcriptional regulator [Coriobacteriales bacterium]|nr:XRE family transcriptional regulator [Coriobacteriales bacterium]